MLRTPRSALLVLVLLACASLGACVLALAVGSVHVPAPALLRALSGTGDDAATAIVRELRMPRAIAAFATGGLLATAGTLMQVLLRNPLADPYVLGLSGGAAVAALTAIATGAAELAGLAALAGALASTSLVFGLARTGDRTAPWNATRLLLTGIVVASGWGAAIALLLSIAPEVQLRGMLFWLIGDLSAAGPPGWAALALVSVISVAWPFARDLNMLARGDAVAASVGVAVPRVTLLAHVLAALATAAAVMTAGSIGFVGLVVPHALRLCVGNDHRVLLPAAALGGGTLLVLADTVARTVVAPTQLPAGVVTALIGVPGFLWLLRRA